MAANIQSFASRRIPAWHGLGIVMDGQVTQEAAGLNWNVYDAPIYTPPRIDEEAGKIIRTPGVIYNSKKLIVRDDTHEPIGVVGSDYTSIQNTELFQFMKDLSEFDVDFSVETAGALGNGETVFVLARMEGLRVCLGNDVIDPYIMLCNGHTGNRKMMVLPTSVRVVCQNTLRMAIAGSKDAKGLSKGWAIRHTTSIHERLAEAKASLQEVAKEWNTTKELMSRLADAKANEDEILKLIEGTFGVQKKDSAKGITIAENRNKAIFDILEGPTSKGLDTEGSIWSAMNAITEWLDHDSIIRSENKIEARIENNLIDGPSINYKEKAWTTAIAMVA
jgi:phage/plasmid-like protein (TIGR03299 family)